MVNGRPWELQDDIKFIELLTSGCSYKEISIQLDRTVNSLYHRAYDLGLTQRRSVYAPRSIVEWAESNGIKTEGK